MTQKWYERSRRRLLLDFHIPDWKEEFFSKFDPEEFARLAKRAGVTAVTIMANNKLQATGIYDILT